MNASRAIKNGPHVSFLVLQPPLVQAIFSGDPEEIRMLIHKTEDVNALVRDAAVVRQFPPSGASEGLLIFSVLWIPVVNSKSSGLLFRS